MVQGIYLSVRASFTDKKTADEYATWVSAPGGPVDRVLHTFARKAWVMIEDPTKGDPTHRVITNYGFPSRAELSAYGGSITAADLRREGEQFFGEQAVSRGTVTRTTGEVFSR